MSRFASLPFSTHIQSLCHLCTSDMRLCKFALIYSKLWVNYRKLLFPKRKLQFPGHQVSWVNTEKVQRKRAIPYSMMTRGSAIAEEPRDVLCQLKYYGRFLTELLTRSSANPQEPCEHTVS